MYKIVTWLSEVICYFIYLKNTSSLWSKVSGLQHRVSPCKLNIYLETGKIQMKSVESINLYLEGVRKRECLTEETMFL